MPQDRLISLRPLSDRRIISIQADRGRSGCSRLKRVQETRAGSAAQIRIDTYARAVRLSTEAERLNETALSPLLSGAAPMAIMALGLLVLLLVCIVLGALAILLIRRIRTSTSETSSRTSHMT